MEETSRFAGRIPILVIPMPKNEEHKVEAYLRGLEPFGEMFVVDSGSTNRTCQLAEVLGACVVPFAWDGRATKETQRCRENLPFEKAER